MEREDKICELAGQVIDGKPVKYLKGTTILEINLIGAIKHAIELTHNNVLSSLAASIYASLSTDSISSKLRDDIKNSAAMIIDRKYESVMAVIQWGDDAVNMTNRAAVVNAQILRMRNLAADSYYGEGGTTYLTSDQMLTNLDALEAITLDDDNEYFRDDFSTQKVAMTFALKRAIARRTEEENKSSREAWKAS